MSRPLALLLTALLGACGAPPSSPEPVASPAPPQASPAPPQASADLHTWAYVTGFQSGRILAVDLDTESVVKTFEVRDDAGLAAFALGPDGTTLFVVDGGLEGSLRELDVRSGAELQRSPLWNRALSLGPSPLFSRVGTELWIGRFDPRTAQRGAELVHLQGLAPAKPAAAWPCADPVLTRGSSVVVVCPRFMQQRGPDPRSTTTPLDAPSEGVATPSRAVVVGRYQGPDLPWWVLDWRAGEAAPRALDLHAVDGLADVSGRGGRAWVEVSPDGETLAVAEGATVWLFGATSHTLRKIVRLPRAVDHLRFTPDGAELVTLESHVGDVPRGASALLRIDAKTGAVRRVLEGKLPQRAFVSLELGPAPLAR